MGKCDSHEIFEVFSFSHVIWVLNIELSHHKFFTSDSDFFYSAIQEVTVDTSKHMALYEFWNFLWGVSDFFLEKK